MIELSTVLNTLAGGVLGFAAAVFADPIRQWMYRPVLRLSFDDEPGCRARTLEQAELDGGPRPVHSTHYAEYVRIRLTNTKHAVARNCRAYLANVEKQDNEGVFRPTIYEDSIPLAWSCREEDAYAGIDLPKGITQFVDVVSTREVSEYFKPEIQPIPYRYMDLFQERGVFRFTVQVSGENVHPELARIVFRWEGQWNEYSAQSD